MFTRKILFVAMLCSAAAVVVNSCKDMGNEPVAPPVQSGGLTAVPPSVTVGSGVTARVAISGGTRPYAVAAAPNPALVSATLSDSTLIITGVTIASAAGATSVKVLDSSPAPGKSVTVPVTKTFP